ncbi:hypothetical protein BDZ89DRAFT_1073504 [Hymenopellis radicata]|nr:hypothetical protein BDZ89DRAFT_1073504 [Hymenopellis radicata]
MFRYLADSGSTLHFTELTFTFISLGYLKAVPSGEWTTIDGYLKAVSAEWGTLDEILSHSAFRGVQRIHFEAHSYESTLITDQAHPALARAIRRTWPCLASRGVLCFL